MLSVEVSMSAVGRATKQWLTYLSLLELLMPDAMDDVQEPQTLFDQINENSIAISYPIT